MRDAPGPPPSEGERKFVTIMFADISGFTAMSESLDPEVVRDLMNACFQDLVPIVVNHGGTIDKFIGDEIMALFGAPVAHEDDPERALRAAFAMFDQLARFNAARRTDLGMHIGLNTGLAVAGTLGAGGREGYSVMGDAVNLASRLADHAERGEILVGPETFRLASHAIEFQAMPSIRLKGKAEPVAVARALRVRGSGRDRARAGGSMPLVESPLIGRERELAQLLALGERVLQGQGAVVSVVGDAGVGKSRLFAEVRRRLAGAGLLCLEGRALSIGQTLSYWPVLDLLRSYAGINELDTEEAAFGKLERRLTALFPTDLEEVLPYLATLLGLDVGNTAFVARVRHLTGDALGRQVFLTSRRFFERLATDHPLMVIFEDLHWADQSSIDLLEHVLPLVHTTPLLVCLVSRPDPGNSAARLAEDCREKFPDRYTEISLAPLNADDSATLLRNLLRQSDISSRFRQLIIDRTEGNPFFMEEIIRTLIELGGLEYSDAAGGWRATATSESVAIPDTLNGVIMARIDRLEEDLKQVLRAAAVVGRSFFYRVLRELLAADRALDEQLAALVKIELIRERRQTPELEYLFKHALAQEAVYDSILHERRRELHRRVAECVESLFANRLEEFYGLLAYHYAQADAWEKAQEYLFKVGDQAERIAADAEALAHYRDAVAAYTRAFGDRFGPAQQASLARKMGQALFRRGNHEQAVEYLEQALQYFSGSKLPASRWSVRWAIGREIVRQCGWLIGGRWRAAPKTSDPHAVERARTREALGWIDYWLNNHERLLLHVLQMLNEGERLRLESEVVRSYAGLAIIAARLGVPVVSGLYQRRAVTRAVTAGDPIATGYGYLARAWHKFHCAGDWSAVGDDLVEAIDAFRKAGDLRLWGSVTAMRVYVEVLRGHFAPALEHAEEMATLGTDAGDNSIAGDGDSVVGYVLSCQGVLDEARVRLQHAAARIEAIPNYIGLANALGILARVYLRQKRSREALETAERAWQLILQRGLRHYLIALALNNIAEVFLEAAETAVPAARPEALDRAATICKAARREGRVSHEGAVGAFRWAGTYEWLRGRQRRARQFWNRSLVEAERLGARHELARTLLEVGRHTGERTVIERAEQLCSELGMRLELAAARALLSR